MKYWDGEEDLRQLSMDSLHKSMDKKKKTMTLRCVIGEPPPYFLK